MPRLYAVKALSYPRGTYNTRRLLPGDSFEAKRRDARILVALGMAREVREAGTLPSPPAGLAKKVKRADDKEALAKLRADYQEVVGKRPFSGWSAAELQRRIDEALAS